jgi:hypothetical protein
MTDDPAKAAACAANNADLYQAVFRAHGLSDHRNAAMWWSEETAPLYYSNLTTLAADAPQAQAEMVERLKSVRGRPFSVKDAFRRLDLEPLGFRRLFEATWIRAEPQRMAQGPDGAMPAGWRRIGDPAALEAWERAWGAGGSPADRCVFPAAILDDPLVAILGRTVGSGFDAGCIVNFSPDVAGMSNVFSTAGRPPGFFEEAASAAAASAPGLPLVGYERGEDLDGALAAGFQPVGGLRVWLLD